MIVNYVLGGVGGWIILRVIQAGVYRAKMRRRLSGRTLSELAEDRREFWKAWAGAFILMGIFLALGVLAAHLGGK
jgi:hypothetical protein